MPALGRRSKIKYFFKKLINESRNKIKAKYRGT